jgi:hypothetical protein
MTEPSHRSHGELTPEQQAAEAYARLAPYEKSFEGTAPDGEWANTVNVTTVAGYDPTRHPEEKAERAADYGDRQLVRIDTDYKATRPGRHPVGLSRPDAVRLAAAVLEAIDDTFDYGRVGELRAAEAAQLLSVLDEVDYALAELRSHALGDLCKRIGVDPDGGIATVADEVDRPRADASRLAVGLPRGGVLAGRNPGGLFDDVEKALFRNDDLSSEADRLRVENDGLRRSWELAVEAGAGVGHELDEAAAENERLREAGERLVDRLCGLSAFARSAEQAERARLAFESWTTAAAADEESSDA